MHPPNTSMMITPTNNPPSSSDHPRPVDDEHNDRPFPKRLNTNTIHDHRQQQQKAQEEEEEEVQDYIITSECGNSSSSTSSSSNSSSSSSCESTGLRLLGLLLQCAEAVAVDNLREATGLLPEIAELSSPFGSSIQRVAAQFAEGLRCRIVSSYVGVYSPLIPPHYHRFYRALQTYNSISPLIKFSQYTANQAISHLPHPRLHLVDLDVMQGLQWPGLFHILHLRQSHNKLHSLRLTGLGASLDLLQSTGRQLSDFAASFRLPFQFHPLPTKPALLSPLDLHLHPDEALVVHWMHHCLYDVTGSDLRTLHLLQALRPNLITIIEQDLSHSGSFLGRFVEALHYYSALFDALGDGAELDSVERCQVEQQLLGWEIRNIVAVGGPKRTGEVKVERWGEELRRLGFRPVSLSGNPAAQATLLLDMFPCKGYTLNEENGCLKLGWKDLSLLTASAWEPSDSVLMPA